MDNSVSSNLSSLASMFSGANKNGQNLSELTNQNFGKNLDKNAIKNAASELRQRFNAKLSNAIYASKLYSKWLKF